jgi:hypothetical protein
MAGLKVSRRYCRKRRYQVPDWSEIRCRFPPKSPAAFDRNQVAGLLRFLQVEIPPGATAGGILDF